MVRVHQRIDRHKIRDHPISIHLIDLKKLRPGTAAHDKSVFCKLTCHLLVILQDIKLPQVLDIAKIRVYRIGCHIGRRDDCIALNSRLYQQRTAAGIEGILLFACLRRRLHARLRLPG